MLPPKKEKVETIAVLKQESKAAVALAELKGVATSLKINPTTTVCCVK